MAARRRPAACRSRGSERRRFLLSRSVPSAHAPRRGAPVSQAILLIEDNLKNAKAAHATIIDDMGYLRDQITTTEARDPPPPPAPPPHPP